jgi:hypothetical protein
MFRRVLMSAIAVVVTAVAMTGCTHRIGDFTMVTTKNYERQVQYKMVGRMEGSDKKLIILAFPLGIPDLKNAVDRAIEAGNGVYLANAVIEEGGWYALLIGQTGYTVTGDVYAAADRGDLLDPNIEKFELREGANGEMAMVSTTSGTSVAVQDYNKLVANH